MTHHLRRHIEAKHSVESVCEDNCWIRVPDKPNIVFNPTVGMSTPGFCFLCYHSPVDNHTRKPCTVLGSFKKHACKPNGKRGVKLGPRKPKIDTPISTDVTPIVAPVLKSVNNNQYLLDTYRDLVDYDSDEDGCGHTPEDMPDLITKALKSALAIEDKLNKHYQKTISAFKSKIANLENQLDQVDTDKMVVESHHLDALEKKQRALDSLCQDLATKEQEIQRLRLQLLPFLKKPDTDNDVISHKT